MPRTTARHGQRDVALIRTGAVVLAALAWVTLLAAAAVAEPPIPVETGSTEPATLRYRYQAGETLQYRFTLDEQTTISDLSTSRRSELELSGSLTLAMVVQRVDVEGDAVVTEELRDPAFEVTADGFELSSRELTRGVTGVARTIELSPRGELLDEEVQATSEASVVRALAVEFARLGETFRLELPDAPVEVGDTFRVEGSNPGGGEGFDRRQSLALTFLGWARVGSRRCAVLEVGGDAWHELGAGVALGEIRGPALSRGVYYGYLYFDPEGGRLVRGQVEIGTVGQVGGAATPLDFTDQARWTVELIE